MVLFWPFLARFFVFFFHIFENFSNLKTFFKRCHGNVLWNRQEIYQIVPSCSQLYLSIALCPLNLPSFAPKHEQGDINLPTWSTKMVATCHDVRHLNLIAGQPRCITLDFILFIRKLFYIFHKKITQFYNKIFYLFV